MEEFFVASCQKKGPSPHRLSSSTSLIVECQVEPEGTDRLSGTSESHIASGSQVYCSPWASAGCRVGCVVVSASGQLTKSHRGEYRALAVASSI